ncbi:MAG: hypothetical protein KF715_15205 [Candidatus Didemnitutus sp.]|nr:hypothetical protein [Candidatus Didemnitutus sp.]
MNSIRFVTPPSNSARRFRGRAAARAASPWSANCGLGFAIVRAVVAILLAVMPAMLAAKPEKWIAVQSPLFTVLTPAPAATARRWAVELEQFRRAMQAVVSVPERQLQPVTVLLFPRDRDLKPFKPLENGKPEEIGGFFVHVGGTHALALALDYDERTARQLVFHEAVHWYSASADQALPAWLEEGVAEVYSTFRAEGDVCSFGALMPDHLRLLLREGVDVGRLVTTPREGIKFNEGNRATLFYARSWLMSHYLLYGRGSPGREAVARYLDGVAHRPDMEGAFRDAFGADYATFGRKLAEYLKEGHYALQRFRVPFADIDAKLIVRPASEAEVERTKGVLLLGSRRGETAAALPYLQRATQLAPSDPLAWQTLAEAHAMAKNNRLAAEHFARAIAAGSRSYYAHYGYAVAKMQASDVTEENFSPVLALEVAKAMRKALELNPRFVPAYQGLAGVVSALEVYEPADRQLLEQGARLAPDDVAIDVGLGVADIREGNERRGRQRLELALVDPHATGDLKQFARRLLHAQDWQDMERELNELFAKSSYARIVSRIDEVRAKFPEPHLRSMLEINRRTALAADRLSRAVEHANAGRKDAARQLLREVVESNAEARDKNEAKRLLGLLAK